MIRQRSLAIFATTIALLAAGCAQRPNASENGGPPKELGEPAVVVTATTTSPGSTPEDSVPGASTVPVSRDGGRSSTTATPPTSGGATGAAAASAPEKLLAGGVADATADTGIEAPAHADLVSVSIEDTRTTLRATVTFAGAIPPELADGEVMGVGVDLFRQVSRESDYQLFATGRVDGWVAYLDTPDGFVKYPGTFTISGSSLVFELPWPSVGGHTAGSFSTFADWSKATVAVVAQTGGDRAPDDGTARFE